MKRIQEKIKAIIFDMDGTIIDTEHVWDHATVETLKNRGIKNFSVQEKLALEDGRIFSGFSFGATGITFGKGVFNPRMSGYQEIFTDPSFKGQSGMKPIRNAAIMQVNDDYYENLTLDEMDTLIEGWKKSAGNGKE